MVHRKIKIKTPTGLIVESAGRLSEVANHYDARITIVKDGVETNAKSLLAVLGACIQYGDEVEFICEGKDEADALRAMERMAEEI